MTENALSAAGPKTENAVRTSYPPAGARLLVYSRVIPPLPNRLAERVLLRGVDAMRPHGTIVAYDGLQLSLRVGLSEIRVTDLN